MPGRECGGAELEAWLCILNEGERSLRPNVSPWETQIPKYGFLTMHTYGAVS